MSAHPVLNHEALAALRFDAGFSQSELARRSGVSQSHISGLESAAKRASPRTVRRLARALDVPVRALITAPGAAQPPEPVA